MTVQATLDNPGHLLRPGLYVTASVAQPARARVIVVPSTALQAGPSGDSVYVVRQGKAVPLAVTAGARVGERIVVERGLQPGDVIITNGQLRVQPGAAVTIAGQPAHG